MESIGIHCRVFNPFVPGLNLFLNNRDHRKITVIDGKSDLQVDIILQMNTLIIRIRMGSGKIQVFV